MTAPSTLSEPTPAAGRPARRWHAHEWNTPLSWELILKITPRLPRFVLAPLHHVTSLLFFACMPRERAAARRNLRRVTGKAGLANLLLTYRLFWNFSRFMVAYTEMRGLDLARFWDRLDGIEETEAVTRKILGEGRGAIIATMHLGHWDLGLKLLAHYQLPVNVVMLSEDPEEVTRFADEARLNPSLRVHRMGGDPMLAVELMLALKRGELVAIQVDRAAGQNVMDTPFFGAPAPLPTGPVQLAMATGAPLIPAFVLFGRGRRFRLLALPPLYFARPGSDGEEAALGEAMRRMAAMMESVVSRHPDQWFNFYDVWPEPGARNPEEAHA